MRTSFEQHERTLHDRIAALKAAQRRADAAALAEGRVSREDLSRRNGYELSRRFKPDMAHATRVR